MTALPREVVSWEQPMGGAAAHDARLDLGPLGTLLPDGP